MSEWNTDWYWNELILISQWTAAVQGASLNVCLYFLSEVSQSRNLQSWQNGSPTLWFLPRSLQPGHQDVKSLVYKGLLMVCLLYLCVLKPQVNGEVPPISSKLASNMVKQLQLSGTCCGCNSGVWHWVLGKDAFASAHVTHCETRVQRMQTGWEEAKGVILQSVTWDLFYDVLLGIKVCYFNNDIINL